MKSKDQIESRLVKLVKRHKSRYIANRLDKLPQNCFYNIVHAPGEDFSIKSSPDEILAPRSSISLVVMTVPSSVRLCTYGSSSPKTWNGDICDSESTSRECPMFKPRVSEISLESEFDSIISDDKVTIQLYPDIAALQWTLNDRYHLFPSGVWPSIKRYVAALASSLLRVFG
jgi:hypothetical protein